MSKVTNQPRVPSSRGTDLQGRARDPKPSGRGAPLDTFETPSQGQRNLRNVTDKGRTTRGTLTSVGGPSTYEPPSSGSKPQRAPRGSHRVR